MLTMVLALAGLLTSANPVRAQGLEVDHLWIHVSPGAPEAVVLSAAGLQIDRGTGVVQHTGQGTASVFVRFENVYLELIWVEDEALLRRVAPEFASSLLGGADASPFGIGLRPTDPESQSLPFATVGRWAEWMRPDVTIQAVPPSEDAPMDPSIFVIPRYLRWDERARAQPELLEAATHQRAIHRLTGVVMRGPGFPSSSEAVQGLAAQSIIEFSPAERHVLELHFDQSRQEQLDFRPALPLVIWH